MTQDELSQPSAVQVDLLFRQGVDLHQRGHLDESRVAFEQVVALAPRHFDALHVLGIISAQKSEFARAAALIAGAISINPNVAAAYYNRGFALQRLGEYASAVESYDAAIRLQPDYVDAHYNRGDALQELRRYKAAVASYDAAIRINPEHSGAYNNRGNALRFLGEYAAAIESYDTAIRLNPSQPSPYSNRGIAFGECRQYERAIDSYDKAIERGSSDDFVHGICLHTRMRICDWSGLDRRIADLTQRIERGEKCTPSFPILAVVDSLDVQRKAAAIWTQSRFPANAALGEFPRDSRDGKIRVGYFSMDFRDHAISYLVAGLIEAHDRERFEIYAFSYGPNTGDTMRRRMESAFDAFFDVSEKSDREAGELARRMNIDIAVDLTGPTGEARSGILAMRAAPVQVNYLGYPGTMAAGYVDYIIADQTVIPDQDRTFYSESVVYLPHSYQVNDPNRSVADRRSSRAELGLPPVGAGFVYCCFNASHKITPRVFDVWMRILKKCDGSVLWLFEDSAAATMNLRMEAEARGVDGRRLVFAKHLPSPEHLARVGEADLVLDTSPYNAHTTASDALRMGVPVLTCPGHSFVSRVAASLLHAIDMPDLIAATIEEYEAEAIDLAHSPERIAGLKRKIALNRATAPLFDAALSARHIEAAYAHMFERHRQGLPPESFKVPRIR